MNRARWKPWWQGAHRSRVARWHAGRRAMTRLLRDCSGVAAIEFALASPLLLILLTGVVEIGMAGYQAMQVQTAAEAGVLYAALNGVTNLAAIQSAITGATGTTGLTAVPAPFVFWGCATASGVTSQGTNSTTVCADKLPPGEYLTVGASLPHQTLMPFLNLPLPATMTASSTVRIQ